MLFDIISASIGIVYIIPLLCYAFSYNMHHLFIWIGLLFTAWFSEFLKYSVIGNSYEFSKRPRGAMNCNAFCTDNSCEGEPGMPSSHAAIATFFALAYMKDYPILLGTYALLIALSRYVKRCHTVLQIGAGTVLGSILYLGFTKMTS